ncbi:hypothetical protein ASZ90_017356 [hydrocarbon metagenome]|uniref:LTD domain-containing protein n=1 Tax=hydrocarbon metagenome TaxID=938273 RepID=A0A0W8EA02_9ZZZZ
MRKTLIVLFTLLICVAFAAPAIAAPTVNLNGQQLSFDVPPTIENGRTLVPLRAIFEAMGATVTWDQNTRTATAVKDGTTVVLKIGSTTPTINGQVKQLDVPAKIVNGRTLAPLRFIGEAFGGTVEWNQASQLISITAVPTSGTPPPSDIYVHFIDVGQADAIYIELPDNNDILIDAGNRADGPLVVNYLKTQGVDDIELLIATHPHEDHIGGLPDVLDAFVVESILDSGYAATTNIYKEYSSKAQAEGCTWVSDNCQTYSWGAITLQILTGNQTWGSNTNDYSVVCRLDTGDIEFMFTGDAETAVEDILTGTLEAEILKVGHHGSTSSSSLAFLNKVDPEVAVISVGEGNTYGHPHEETLGNLENIGASIYRTDLNGTIVVRTNGSTYTVSTDTNPQVPVTVSPIPIQNPAGNAPKLIPDPTDTSDWIAITNIDLQGEVVTIKNNSIWTVDMTGWYLVSVTGNQTFYFPNNFTLAGGDTVYITSGKGAIDQYPTYLKWTGSYIWNNDGDPGKLYNAYGQLVAQWP